MRAWIFSDLHVDVNKSKLWHLPRPAPDHDVVIIAGDICEGLCNGVEWIVQHELNAKPVIYVPGNHEYYGFDFKAEREEGRAAAAAHSNIHLLDRDVMMIGGVAFLGATLWTDYRLYGEASAHRAMLSAEQSMNDHRHIRCNSRPWSTLDAIAEHEQSRTWLELQLDAIDVPSVVVTHAAPSLNSIAAWYRDDPITAAFASNLDHLIGGARLWVHGHTHVGCDYTHGSSRVVANPRGYVIRGEDKGFRSSFTCEVNR